jgi:hypothetical protein
MDGISLFAGIIIIFIFWMAKIDDTGYVWTGIADPLDFAAGESCDSWGNINAANGHLGIWHQNNRAAFKPDNIAGSSCNGSQRLYCVEQ